jgi:hypothetical protein
MDIQEPKVIEDKEPDWWDDLTQKQKEDIEAGLDDLDHNRKKSFTTVLLKYK